MMVVSGCRIDDARSLIGCTDSDDDTGMGRLAAMMLGPGFGSLPSDRLLVKDLAWRRGGARAMLDAGTPRFDLMDDDTVDHVMAENGGFGHRRDCDSGVWDSLKRSLAPLSCPLASPAVREREIVRSDPRYVDCVRDTADGRYETLVIHAGMTGMHIVAYPVYGRGSTIRADMICDDRGVERCHESTSCYLDVDQGFGVEHELLCGESREFSSDGLHDDRRLMLSRIVDMLSKAESYAKGDYRR